MEGELNPNHPVVREIHDYWYKVAAMLLYKLAKKEKVVITPEEIARAEAEGINIVFEVKEEKIYLYLVDNEEAVRLAKKSGGLPV